MSIFISHANTYLKRLFSRVSAMLLLLSLLSVGPVWAGGGSENVLLVVNADSFSSMTLANEYIRLRQVPACNVVYLNLGDLHDQSTVEIHVFRERILRPVFRAITERGLAAQIDCVAYSSDVHYAVDFRTEVTPEVRTRIGPNGEYFIKYTTAATTGLTYLHRHVLTRSTLNYLSPTANRYMRQAGKLNLDTAQLQRQLDTVRQQLRAKEFDKAQTVMADLLRAFPNNPEIHYIHACLLAGQGKPDDATTALRTAVERGFNKPVRADTDDLLASLRKREDFQKLLEQMKDAKPIPVGMDDSLHTQPTLAFRSAMRWDEKNNPTINQPGESYMLSTMLAWTSGRGISIRQGLDSLRRSAAVDGTHPKGTFYFMVNKDPRSATRQWGFASAAARLRELGHQAELVEGVLPKDRKDIMGLVAGSATFRFANSGNRILPGAICEHLTSFGGMLFEGAGQTACTEFLRFGAAGTSGTVAEPYALQVKFPSPFLHVHYARGCNLAEAFYQSVQGPYQLIILGDPLCQPWASIPTVKFEGLLEERFAPGQTVKGTLVLTPSTEDPSDKIAQWLLFVNGKNMAACLSGGTLRFDTTLLPDGLHELRIVCVRDGPIMTQGRAIVTVNVANTDHDRGEVKLADARVTFGQTTTLTARVKGAKNIRVLFNGLELGAIEGESGAFTVDSSRLGMGKLRLVCEAVLGDKPTQRIVLPPVELQVDEPAVGGGVSGATAQRLDQQMRKPAPGTPAVPRGFTITADGKTQPAASMRDGNWLVAGGAVRGKPFTLHGYFRVTGADLYQLQVFFDGELTVEVDGKILASQHSVKGWRHVPMALKPGWHEIKITATAAGTPAMDLRFGNQGTQRLVAERIFRLPQ